MKKKILSFCLIGITLMGTKTFAASSVSKNCSLTGYYTSGTNYTATGTSTSPSSGLSKIAVYLSTNNGNIGQSIRNQPFVGSKATKTITGTGATYVYSDHIWNYTDSNEEITKSIYLYDK